MGIDEKQATDKKYVIILRNNAAIDVECADVYMKDQWVEFKDELGKLLMAVPIDLILMVTTPERFAVFQQAAEAERVRQSLVDPQGILDPNARVVQP